MFRLVTTYYPEPNSRRRDELEFCLGENLSHFDEVVVLSQSVDRPDGFPPYPKGQWFTGRERQLYSDLLALAGRTVQPDLAGPAGDYRNAPWNQQIKRGAMVEIPNSFLPVPVSDDVIVIANSDIIIPRTELHKIAANLQRAEVYCLTRWDITTQHGIELFDAVYSQDAWAFRGEPREGIAADFPLGCPGCDNRFAAELEAVGYTVLNPSRDIRIYHLHLSAHRTSNTPDNRVPLPYLFVKPAKLGEAPSYCRPTKASRRPSQFRV